MLGDGLIMQYSKKNIVVTGATSGIGFSTCELLLQNGFKVIGVGHSKENCEKAYKDLNVKFSNADIIFFYGDMIQQQEVIRIGEDIKKYLHENCNDKLFAIINNAGCVRSWYMTSNEGYEQQFALNHLAGFLLTYELFSNLLLGKGRILFTSSDSHKMMKMRWKDLMFEMGYNPLLAYKQSKLCNMLTAYTLNERYRNKGIAAYGVDPGLVSTNIGNKNTGWLVNFIWSMRKKHGVDSMEAAKTYLMLCMEETPPRELYFRFLKPHTYSKQVNKENSDRLFVLSEKLCNINYLG